MLDVKGPPGPGAFAARLFVNAETHPTPNLYVQTPDGLISEAMALRQPRTSDSVYAVLDCAVTKDQTLRINYSQNDSKQSSLGIGGYDQAERAYRNEESYHGLRIQEVGPLGRRAFTNTRMPPGIFITGSPGGNFNVQTMSADALPRFRVGIVVNQNLTNRPHYVGYSGTLSSPLFGQPTAVQGMRRVDVGLNFNFRGDGERRLRSER